MEDHIAKQRLNVILLVDCSTSMRGERISQVNKAIEDIKENLKELQIENSNADFYLTVITFSTEAYFLNNKKMKNIESFNFNPIKAGGWSNLHLGLDKLEEILDKESKGGLMPDFGGLAPIILLLSDGHPTGNDYKESLKRLENKSWYKVALRYGIAIELNDEKTINVLRDFVKNNGDVIDCYDAKLLQRIIKIIVVTASKVKSTSSSVHQQKSNVSVNIQVQQEVANALSDVDDWEW